MGGQLEVKASISCCKKVATWEVLYRTKYIKCFGCYRNYSPGKFIVRLTDDPAEVVSTVLVYKIMFVVNIELRYSNETIDGPLFKTYA